MDEVLQSIIDALKRYKQLINEEKKKENEKPKAMPTVYSRVIISYVAENWYGFWFNWFNETFAETLSRYLEEHKVEDILSVLVER